MTFDMLEKRPEVTPLLVRLYDTHNLYSLAGQAKNDAACAELTEVMVDLLNIKLSERESELITDVLLALMKQAQIDLKAALADRLSGMDQVPLRIILGLANDDIAVADPILRKSPLLQDLDLIYILQGHGISHGRSIARRPGLSGDLIDMLADTNDGEIAVNLSENAGVTLTPHAYDLFSEMAQSDEALARPLLLREDVPQDVAGKLYAYVSEELKKTLKERFGIGGIRAAEALDLITEELSNTAGPVDPYDQQLASAHNQHRRGELNMAVIMASLRRGQYSTFVAQFSVFFGLPVATTKSILKQESGKVLAIACRSLGIPKMDYAALYILCERFRSGSRMTDNQKEVRRVMAQYEDIDQEKARQIMRDSRH